jgi:plastocyanin
VTISAPDGGTSCSGDPATERAPVLAPETLTVKVREEFQFENTDVVPHEIRGTDGTLWLTVPAKKLSDFTLITKAGTWGYRVSACAKGGAVTVE